jgi:hypothetical protein
LHYFNEMKVNKDEASCVTGAELMIDGGYLAQ